jgi:tetratricopeptide (TPR) repeat protein
VTLYAISYVSGIQGLRVAHAGIAISILGLAWWLLRRASDSAILASFGTLLFANLAAYRLVQLRPHLFTLLATLVLVCVLTGERRPPSWRRAAFVVVLFVLWANAHAAFVLGPALLGGAVFGVLASHLIHVNGSEHDLQRAKRLAGVCGVATLATLLGPAGPAGLFHYLMAGGATPALEVVGDEWAGLRLFAWPPQNLPPSALAWVEAWLLLLSTSALMYLEVRRYRRQTDSRVPEDRPEREEGVDPALLGMALISLVAMVAAVRFLWLGIIPLLAMAEWAAARRPEAMRTRARTRWGATAAIVAIVALLPLSHRFGDWPMISQGVHPSVYARPYPAIKYYAHGVWILADANLEGNLYNSYFMGNFLGYWLAPRMQAFVNGSLNLPAETMQDSLALVHRRGSGPGESFVDLLDRHHVDVFFGNGMPMISRPNRPAELTTSHMESTPGWMLLFRNVHAAIWLRTNQRNQQNLQRMIAFYEREGVPFDPSRGFEVSEVIRLAPGWARDKAIVPSNFAALQGTALSPDPESRRAAQGRLASLYLLLGEYERASVLDRKLLRSDPSSAAAARRLVWSALRQGRFEESREAARQLLELTHPEDRLSGWIIDVAERSESLPPDEMRRVVATLPVFSRVEAASLFSGFREPEARQRRGMHREVDYSLGGSFSK